MVLVRPPRPSDADLFLRLQRSCFPWLSEPNARESTEVAFESIVSGATSRSTHFAIAEFPPTRFAGYAASRAYMPVVAGREIATTDQPVAVVSQVAVVPAQRGSGVGRKLLNYLVSQLGAADYSLAIAHIAPRLGSWYSAQGWKVLPPGIGLCWIAPPSSLNALVLPSNAPPADVRSHTQVLYQPPEKEHGFTALAVRALDSPNRLIAVSPYWATGDAREDGRRAARALKENLTTNPRARSLVPAHSSMMIELASRGEDEAREVPSD